MYSSRGEAGHFVGPVLIQESSGLSPLGADIEPWLHEVTP